jgi:hypothetical protein
MAAVRAPVHPIQSVIEILRAVQGAPRGPILTDRLVRDALGRRRSPTAGMMRGAGQMLPRPLNAMAPFGAMGAMGAPGPGPQPQGPRPPMNTMSNFVR